MRTRELQRLADLLLYFYEETTEEVRTSIPFIRFAVLEAIDEQERDATG